MELNISHIIIVLLIILFILNCNKLELLKVKGIVKTYTTVDSNGNKIIITETKKYGNEHFSGEEEGEMEMEDEIIEDEITQEEENVSESSLINMIIPKTTSPEVLPDESDPSMLAQEEIQAEEEDIDEPTPEEIGEVEEIVDKIETKKDCCHPKYIKVKGSSETTTPPDMAIIYGGLITRGTNPTKIQNDNKIQTNNIIDRLKKEGVKSEDIITHQYTLQENIQHNPETKKKEMNGYILSHILSVKVHNLHNLGRYVDIFFENGTNKIENITYKMSPTKKSQLKMEALQNAVSQAKQKASVIAQQSNQKLGNLMRVAESEVFVSHAKLAENNLSYATKNISSQIKPKNLIVSVSVNAEFNLGVR